jgi:Rad3-related DNA helicase
MDPTFIKIMGYDIFFPDGKRPFPAQLAVISKALVALSKKQNALLESPTGMISRM